MILTSIKVQGMKAKHKPAKPLIMLIRCKVYPLPISECQSLGGSLQVVTMAKDHKGEFSKNDKILLESFTPRMTQVFDDQFGKLRPDIQHKRKSRDYQRASKDKYKQKGHG
ncbi:hypothetical protein F2Q70_00039077 [Brassica cretica]|uniref:Uncharacterized protein n=1 Tax=Brassica cretica TaxID=69181 RepID=A0A8S9K3F5_BRACR|nr:hypothetical protein F2Q70_00039077 [Brassica cretica]